MSRTTKKEAAALLRALKQQEIDQDVADVLAMSDEELDRAIADAGGDPAAIRASGAALAKDLGERRERLAWQAKMHDKLADFRDEAARAKTKTPLPRPELLRRLQAAKIDPRFASPVAALFRKKTPADSTDEELQTLLDQIELLAKKEPR